MLRWMDRSHVYGKANISCCIRECRFFFKVALSFDDDIEMPRSLSSMTVGNSVRTPARLLMTDFEWYLIINARRREYSVSEKV